MTRTPVTVSITRTVPPERAREFAAWARAGEDLLRESPGYLGSGWVRPDEQSDEWHMLFRFADAASLERWESSEERRWWISTARGLAEDARQERLTGIEGWFDTPRRVETVPATTPTPPRWKQMIAIMLVFYPLSLATNAALAPIGSDWPLWMRVLALVVIVSPLMTYLGLPLITRALRPWLLRGR
jgi:uncharacterized protein